MMRILETIGETRAEVGAWRRAGESVGLVPTMGYLHAGHLKLVEESRARCKRTVVSIFVNPTQFGPNEDFSSYPRDFERDADLLREAGVDAIFAPSVTEMYPRAIETRVMPGPMGEMLIGALRPGHFAGVATVVSKLFNIVAPDRAFFGEKDFQQLQIVKRMVADLSMPVEIVGVPTVREADGLAMSSRNVKLTGADRAAARVLSRALEAGARALEGGQGEDEALRTMRGVFAGEPAAELLSLDIRDAETLQPAADGDGRPVAVLVTARVGGVFLIDQWTAEPPRAREAAA